jgi:hypothetical protein
VTHSSRSRATLAIALVATAGALATWLLETTPSHLAQSPEPPVEAVAPPQHDGGHSQPPAHSLDRSPVPVATADAKDPVSLMSAERAAAGLAAAREAAFRAESVDTAWAVDASAALQQALSADAVPTGTQLRSLECRSYSCRLELIEDGSAPLETVLSRLTEGMSASRLSKISSGPTAEDGAGSIVLLYLSR